MSEHSSGKDSAGLVSQISYNHSADDELFMREMLNQGQRATENYVHVEEAVAERHPKPLPAHKLGDAFNIHRGRERMEEPFNAHRNAHYSKFKFSNKQSIDEGDLLKSVDTNRGKTDAHWAAEKGDLETLSRIKKSVLNARDDEGWSPSMYAALTGQLGALQLLHEMEVSMEVVDTVGRTLLHIAASFGHENIISWLLKLKFDINATDFYEMTPLHLAAASNQTGATSLLLLNGADITFVDDQNRTALKVAQIAGHPEIIDLLRNTEQDPF